MLAPELKNTTRSVLIVDDSRMQRKILCGALRRWGYVVHEADSGDAALEFCRQNPIEMIISDWMMPGMSGPEFCRAFREMDFDGYGYFLLLTSKNASEEIAQGLNSGADDFLTKPVSFGELQARLQAGERILRMQEQLIEKNDQVVETLDKLREMYSQLDKDLDEARSLQLSLVPDSNIDLPEGNIAMLLRPCGHIGGDLVGKFQVSDRELGLFSLDVSGHGISSALMTARLAGCLNGMSPSQNVAIQKTSSGGYEAIDPADAARTLNDLLLSELETEHYFTLALAIVDLPTGKVRCVQAGHPHPVIFDAEGNTEFIGHGGLPIGLIENADYQSFSFTLKPGQSLMLHSDGITESSGEEGTLLDEGGLATWIGEAGPKKPSDMLEYLVANLEDFSGSAEFLDDVSAIVFHYVGMDAITDRDPTASRVSLVA